MLPKIILMKLQGRKNFDVKSLLKRFFTSHLQKFLEIDLFCLLIMSQFLSVLELRLLSIFSLFYIGLIFLAKFEKKIFLLRCFLFRMYNCMNCYFYLLRSHNDICNNATVRQFVNDCIFQPS